MSRIVLVCFALGSTPQPDSNAPVTGENTGSSPAVSETPPPSAWDRQREKESGTDSRPPAAGSDSFGRDVGRMLLTLILVVGLIYVFGKVVLARLATLRFGGRGGNLIKVLERVQLDARHGLTLVEIDGHRLLLGSGDGGVRIVQQLDSPGQSPSTATVSSFETAMSAAQSTTKKSESPPHG